MYHLIIIIYQEFFFSLYTHTYIYIHWTNFRTQHTNSVILILQNAKLIDYYHYELVMVDFG